MNNLKGIGHLVWNHAFYDAKLLESFIRFVSEYGRFLVAWAGDEALVSFPDPCPSPSTRFLPRPLNLRELQWNPSIVDTLGTW